MKPDRALSDNDAMANASQWLSRQRAGDMTERERQEMSAWIAAAPENGSALEKLERIWTIAGRVEDDPAIMDMRDAARMALRREAGLRALSIAAAASVMAAVAGLAMQQMGVLPQFVFLQPPPMQAFQTVVGERKSITLADGSIVTLDTDTALRARVSGSQRRIELERGRAFFQVAKDRSRPFIVAAAGKTVRATGTAFDVRVDPGRFQVTLIEGRVVVQERGANRDDGPMADMRPGWRLAIGDDMRWRMEPIDLGKAMSWREGTLVFFHDPLETAVAEMNRYSTRKISFKGAPPDSIVIGNFQAGDIDSFIRAVKLNRLARVVSEDEAGVELAAF